jgi:transglutaminase-like putative cysteine protease
MKLKASTDFAYHVDYPTPIITILRPRPHVGQTVLVDEMRVSPEVEIKQYQDFFGNTCQRMIWQEGKVEIRTETTAEVADEVEKNETAIYIPVEQLPNEVLHFLLPSRYCLSDTDAVLNLANQIIGNIEIGYQQVESIRQWIYQNIRYEYGHTFSHTNSNDIIKTKIGVCRDFSHLAIALCRSLSIPARMVVGFTKKLPVPDLHAWFEAYVGNQWYTFDAVQEETSGGRIVMAYGRDASDVAFLTQFGDLKMLSMNVKVEEIF